MNNNSNKNAKSKLIQTFNDKSDYFQYEKSIFKN